MASGTGDRRGADWSAEENDILIADYFAMLGEELAGRDYVKAHDRQAVVERIGRSEGSVETQVHERQRGPDEARPAAH